MLESCRAHGLRPVVTLNHFTTPLWFAARGGFERADAPALFARYCGKVAVRLGKLMHLVSTFNEANIRLLVDLMPQYSEAAATARASIAAAAAAINSPRFSRLAYADLAIATPILQEAHRQGYAAIKTARPELPVGLTLTTQDIQVDGPQSLVETYRERLYGNWVQVAREHADFFGVQTYTRFIFGPDGLLPPPPESEMTAAGYEFYPQALANTIRWAHEAIGKPIYVTESGIATEDDTRRIAFIDQGARRGEGVSGRGHSGPQLSLLVAARQFRMDRGLRRPLRPGCGRPLQLRTHAEAERLSSGSDRQGQPDLKTGPTS